MNVPHLSDAEVRERVSVRNAIDAVRDGFRRHALGELVLPPRMVFGLDSHANAHCLNMSAAIRDGDYLGTKIVTVVRDNPQRGLPRLQAVYLLFNARTGELLCTMDASWLTALRTAAASAVATDLFAATGDHDLLILGCGLQAETHLLAMQATRPLRTVWISGRTRASAELFISSLQARHDTLPLLVPVDPAALPTASIVCTVTSSVDPVLPDSVVAHNAHINAVGSFRPDVRELESATIARAVTWGDISESVHREKGDFLQPLQEGVIAVDHLQGELGECVLDPSRAAHPGRPSVYLSCGSAFQDLVVASLAWSNNGGTHSS